ncbi:hypothetical protein [Actinokineospora sp. NPDC004072]
MTSSFEAHLDQLAPVANEVLPSLADAVRAQHRVVTTHEGLAGPGEFAAADPMQRAYAEFTDILGTRLWLGGQRIDDTAQVLGEIIASYRKADGR